MTGSEYENTYPKYCKSCKGWGIFIKASPDVFFWECDCLKQGRCPRCGADHVLDYYKCKECNWDVSDSNRGLAGGSRIDGTNWIIYGPPK